MTSTRKYNKIVSLDFELYNTKYYWSICWAGVVMADTNFNVLSSFDIIINPGVKEKFVGGEMTFPFDNRVLASKNNFDKHSSDIFGFIDSDTLVVGHAIANDLRMIIDTCAKYNIKVPEFDFIDTNILYNAFKGESGEHALGVLGAEFEIEFLAHNPEEDARATLQVAQNCVGKIGIEEFLRVNNIEVGTFAGGIIRRTLEVSMSNAQKSRINNINAIFDKVKEVGQGAGEKYFFDNAIQSENNISDIIESLLKEGKRIAGSSYSSDRVITNNLSLKNEKKYTSFKNFLEERKIDTSKYDFAPQKIRDEYGRKITLTQYYSRAFSKYYSNGVLDDMKVSFSKGAEKNPLFEECLIKIISSGGTVCPKVEESDIFVVTHFDDINNNFFDGRIKAYKKGRKPKLMEFKEIYCKL